jgi:hypothetical protein
MSNSTLSIDESRWNGSSPGSAGRPKRLWSLTPDRTSRECLRAPLAASEPPHSGVFGFEDDGTPVLAARREPGGTTDTLVITCPYCGGDHRHGAGGGDGHRVAHCRVPGNGLGYVLREVA